jgi:hypothetical protein
MNFLLCISAMISFFMMEIKQWTISFYMMSAFLHFYIENDVVIYFSDSEWNKYCMF